MRGEGIPGGPKRGGLVQPGHRARWRRESHGTNQRVEARSACGLKAPHRLDAATRSARNAKGGEVTSQLVRAMPIVDSRDQRETCGSVVSQRQGNVARNDFCLFPFARAARKPLARLLRVDGNAAACTQPGRAVWNAGVRKALIERRNNCDPDLCQRQNCLRESRRQQAKNAGSSRAATRLEPQSSVGGLAWEARSSVRGAAKESQQRPSQDCLRCAGSWRAVGRASDAATAGSDPPRKRGACDSSMRQEAPPLGRDGRAKGRRETRRCQGPVCSTTGMSRRRCGACAKQSPAPRGANQLRGGRAQAGAHACSVFRPQRRAGERRTRQPRAAAKDPSGLRFRASTDSAPSNTCRVFMTLRYRAGRPAGGKAGPKGRREASSLASQRGAAGTPGARALERERFLSPRHWKRRILPRTACRAHRTWAPPCAARQTRRRIRVQVEARLPPRAARFRPGRTWKARQRRIGSELRAAQPSSLAPRPSQGMLQTRSAQCCPARRGLPNPSGRAARRGRSAWRWMVATAGLLGRAPHNSAVAPAPRNQAA